MKPLIFLGVKSFFNGIKRALSSSRRVIGTLFFLSYWIFLVIRPFDRGQNSIRALSQGPLEPMKFDFPSPVLADSLSFALFGVMSFLLLSGILAYRGTFKPADVDVLFPTPVSPQIVLIFRLVRDQMVTVLFPFIMALFGGRMNFDAMKVFFNRFPEHGSYLSKALPISWFLMSLCWVCIGYAASLFVNRNDLESDRNRKIINWTLFAALSTVAFYIVLSLRQEVSLEVGINITQNVFLRALFLPATAATALVMAPITGNVMQGVLGLGGLIALIAGPLALAMTQVGNMYDQASTRGSSAETFRELQRQGDSYAMIAAQAREGKYKLKQGRASRYVAKLKMTGASALLWKQLVLSARSAGVHAATFVVVAGFVGSIPLLSPKTRSVDILMFLLQSFFVFLFAMAASQAGFIELLRRVDLQKPLPIPSSKIVLWEVFAKSIPLLIFLPVINLVSIGVRPAVWIPALTCLFTLPTLGIMLVSVVLMISVLFPDFEDPTQRGFRGLVMLLAVAMVSAPSLGVLILFRINEFNLLSSALIVVPINIAITAILCRIAGTLYSTYNPSE